MGDVENFRCFSQKISGQKKIFVSVLSWSGHGGGDRFMDMAEDKDEDVV